MPFRDEPGFPIEAELVHASLRTSLRRQQIEAALRALDKGAYVQKSFGFSNWDVVRR